MLKRTFYTACALLFASSAYAATDCSNAEDQATMTKCASEELAAADKKLNELYKTIEKRLADDHDTKKLLINAQRAWIGFRDSECTFAASGTDGGSIHPMMVTMCKTSLTNIRNQQLSDYLKCEEGDVTCVVPAE